MSELKTNLQTILNEKNEKIIPENIKKGVSIFDVTGTYEGSGGIKQFSTVEEMQADSTAKEGDLAVVYGAIYIPIKPGEQYDNVYCPDIVVLDEALSSKITIGSAFSKPYISITSSAATFSFSGMGTSNAAKYTSSDGITYTRTDTLGNPVSMNNRKIDLSRWNDVIGKFLRTGGSAFEGLYEYGLTDDTSKVYLHNHIKYESSKLVYDNVGEISFEDLQKIFDIYKPESSGTLALLKTGDREYTYHMYHFDSENLHTAGDRCYYIDNTHMYVGTYVSNSWGYEDIPYFSKHVIDLKTNTKTDYYYTTADTKIRNLSGFTIYYLDDIDYYDTPYLGSMHYNRTNNEYIMTGWSTQIICAPSSNLSLSSIDPQYVKIWKYNQAPSQLTLSEANQLLPGVIAYGKNGVLKGDGGVVDVILNDTKSGYFMEKYLGLTPTDNSDIYENNLFTSNASLTKAIYCKNTTIDDEHTISIQKLVNSRAITDTKSNQIYFINTNGTRIAYVDLTEKLIKVCDANTLEVLYSTSYIYDYEQITYLNDNIYYMYKDSSYYVYKQLNMNTLELSTVITTSISASTSIDSVNYGTCVRAIKNRYVIGNPYYKTSSETYRVLYLYDTVTNYSGIISNYSNSGNTSDIYCCTDESSNNDDLYIFHSYRDTSGDRHSYGYKYNLISHTKTQLYSANFGANSWGPSPKVGTAGYVSGDYLYYGVTKANLTNGTITPTDSDIGNIFYSNIPELPYYSVGSTNDIIIDDKTLKNYVIRLYNGLYLDGDTLKANVSVKHYLPLNIYNQNVCPIKINNNIYYNGNTILLPDKYKLGSAYDFDIVIFNTKNNLPTDSENNKSYAMVLKNYMNYSNTITPTE